jgi:hypothetical protein
MSFSFGLFLHSIHNTPNLNLRLKEVDQKTDIQTGAFQLIQTLRQVGIFQGAYSF